MKNDNKIHLHLSDDFKDILLRILKKGDSTISKELLELDNNEDNSFDISYIDRTDNDNFVSYISSNRLNRLEEDESPWKYGGREETRIGRVLRRLFGTEYGQQSIETFVNKYKAIVRLENNFQNFDMVSGDDIRKWYLGSNYYENRGVLGGSCMKGRGSQNFFKIYTENPNQVRLCILKNDDGDKIKGRAIVWNLSKPDNMIFMDRIYTSDDADVNLFLEYAKKNGFYVKKRQTYRGENLISPDGKILDGIKIEVQLENSNFNRYPYMDTLKMYYPEENILANYHNDNYGEYRTLEDTGGYYDEYNGDYDPVTVLDWRGNEINEDDAVYCEYDDVYCLRAEAIYVSKGENGRGKYFLPHSEFLKYSEYSDSYYYKDDVIYSEFMKDWIYKKYAVKMYLDKDKKNWVWNHRLTLHDGMGKVGDEYFINDILYREEIEVDGEMVGGDYHFKDEKFENLPVAQDEDEYFGDIPSDTQIEK